MATLSLGPLKKFLQRDRYLLTLTSESNPSVSRDVVLFRLARQGLDNFYAIESECPHAGAPLIDSEISVPADDVDIEDIDDVVIQCPWHSYDFRLSDGESSSGLKACTWKVEVSVAGDGNEGERMVTMLAPPEDANDWTVKALDAVSEDFAGPSIPPSLPTEPPETLTDWGVLILNTPNPDQKVALTREACRLMREGNFSYPDGVIGKRAPPDKPPRLPLTDKPVQATKPGKAGSTKAQKQYLHAMSHVEQWAIDLALDLIVRFARPFGDEEPMPLSFFEDWMTIAEEEAKHFTLLRSRLEAKGSYYGEYKTQDGLWDSAHSTRDDIKARLSIVCLVHEARGLDVNPSQILKFRSLLDPDTADTLTIVHADEITHVAAGNRYLTYVCDKQGLDPVKVFRENVREHYKGRLKGPFNKGDRAKAGLREEWYAEW